MTAAGVIDKYARSILASHNLRDALEQAFRLYELTNDGIRFDLICGSEDSHVRIHVLLPTIYTGISAVIRLLPPHDMG